MTEFKLEVGTKMNLSGLVSNPEVAIEHITDNATPDGKVFYTFNNEKCYSPLTSIHCNAEGWYSLEVIKRKTI